MSQFKLVKVLGKVQSKYICLFTCISGYYLYEVTAKLENDVVKKSSHRYTNFENLWKLLCMKKPLALIPPIAEKDWLIKYKPENDPSVV